MIKLNNNSHLIKILFNKNLIIFKIVLIFKSNKIINKNKIYQIMIKYIKSFFYILKD